MTIASSHPLPLFHVVGFSGHRDLADPIRARESIRAALESLRKELPSQWIALSSVAAGADTAFVREALAQSLPWQAILPMPREIFRNDFLPEEWIEAEGYLAQAAHVQVPAEPRARDEAFLDAGLETVDGSDVIIALWDGKPSRGKGGTADVVAYARQTKKPLIVIDAETFEAKREHFDRLRSEDEEMTFLNKLPMESAAISPKLGTAPEAVVRFHLKTGHAAKHMAPYSRTLAGGTVLLHVLATLIATAALAFGLHWLILPWIKLACVVSALVVALVLRHQHHHHRWILCRFACEISRAAIAMWELPRAGLFFRDLELPTLKQLARSLHILHQHSLKTDASGFEAYKARYLNDRIDNQLSYYHRQEMKALPRLRALKTGFWVTTVAVILCCAAYAIVTTFHLESLPHAVTEIVFYFAPIVLPAVAAAFISLISINDLQRRVAKYRVMQHTLAAAREQLEFSQTWTSLEKAVHKVEKALLQEILEWHALMSFSESH